MAIETHNRVPPAEIHSRADSLKARYESCDICAHECGVDRTDQPAGICSAPDTPTVSSAHPHFGEEDVLRGTGGSGTIFLGSCNMNCVFCQNADISQKSRGSQATPDGIADIMCTLESRGCHNINFVSPTHFTPSLVRAIALARERGLSVPIVWNCGGYERPAVLEELAGVIDIYMPDVKWGDNAAAKTYSKTPGYWDRIQSSLREMHRQVGDLTVDDSGIAQSGLLVRHLVMPNHVESAKAVLTFLATELSRDTYVNIMSQYRPAHLARESERYADIDRSVTAAEYDAVVEYADEVGLHRINTS